MSSNEPFFHRDGDRLVPTVTAKGPWGESLHGRVIVGLLAAEIERQHCSPKFHPARMTVDMFRAPGLVPTQVRTRRVRDGRRIRVVDAELVSDGQVAGRATCQFLARTQNPQGKAWHGDRWSAPLPDSLPQGEPQEDTMFGQWEMRWITGNIYQAGKRELWMRELRELVGGEPLTPFMRVALGADYASPLANVGEGGGYTFINSDLTLYLSRLPAGEWVGYESLAHEASEGIAIGHCNLYDESGRIGWASACGLAQRVRAP